MVASDVVGQFLVEAVVSVALTAHVYLSRIILFITVFVILCQRGGFWLLWLGFWTRLAVPLRFAVFFGAVVVSLIFDGIVFLMLRPSIQLIQVQIAQ